MSSPIDVNSSVRGWQSVRNHVCRRGPPGSDRKSHSGATRPATSGRSFHRGLSWGPADSRCAPRNAGLSSGRPRRRSWSRVFADPRGRLRVHRHVAPFAALPGHSQVRQPAARLKVADAQTAEFHRPQAVVEQARQHRPVPLALECEANVSPLLAVCMSRHRRELIVGSHLLFAPLRRGLGVPQPHHEGHERREAADTVNATPIAQRAPVRPFE